MHFTMCITDLTGEIKLAKAKNEPSDEFQGRGGGVGSFFYGGLPFKSFIISKDSRLRQMKDVTEHKVAGCAPFSKIAVAASEIQMEERERWGGAGIWVWDQTKPQCSQALAQPCCKARSTKQEG